MKRILTYGTFDLLHYGHIRLLQRAKALGDYLIVALSTDEFNALKGKKSYHPYKERKEMLEAIRYVDLVIPEENWGHSRPVFFETNVYSFCLRLFNVQKNSEPRFFHKDKSINNIHYSIDYY